MSLDDDILGTFRDAVDVEFATILADINTSTAQMLKSFNNLLKSMDQQLNGKHTDSPYAVPLLTIQQTAATSRTVDLSPYCATSILCSRDF